MESEGPQLPAVCFCALNYICLVPHSRADVVSKGNVVCKYVHVGAALKCTWYVLSQCPEHQRAKMNTHCGVIYDECIQDNSSLSLLCQCLTIRMYVPHSCAKVGFEV